MADEVPDIPPHPLDDGIDEIAKFTTEDLRGTSRLGSLAFDTAPQQVGQILQTLRDLRLEDWDEFDDAFKGSVIGQIQTLLSTLESMRQLEASNPSATALRQSYQTAIDQASEWFRANARPRAFQVASPRSFPSGEYSLYLNIAPPIRGTDGATEPTREP